MNRELKLPELPEPQILGWSPVSGTWYGYTREQVEDFASLVRSAALEELKSEMGHLTARAGLPSTAQPSSPRFQWCCENGCGTCDAKRIDYEYSRTEDAAGKVLERKTTPMLVSKCCGAALTMWDNLRDEEVSMKGAQL